MSAPLRGEASTTLVNSVLDEYGRITRAALEDYLPRSEPRRHLYDLVADYPRRGGKMLRPSLCIATARAFGAQLDDAIETAASIELFHNALLIHDDIEDESDERRGQPTLHKLHGVAMALNAGDTLSLMALRPLLANHRRLGTKLTMRLLQETERMARESAEGQALELGWRGDNRVDLTDADYLMMVLKKTCWLAAIYPTRVGAMIATRDRLDLDPFQRFGFFMGAAFQIQDDLLNLVGSYEDYGKEISGDLREGKRTLMLIRLFELASPPELERLAAILARPRDKRTTPEISWMLERMAAYDTIEYAAQVARALAGAALHEFELIFSGLPDSRDKRFIESLVLWMLERKH